MDDHLEPLDIRRLEPTLDANGLLWFAGRWTSIPDSQLAVVDLLLQNPGRLVPTEAVSAAYATMGGSDHKDSIKTMIGRLTSRLRQLGLQLYTVRRQGVILELPTRAPRGSERDS